MSSMSCCFPAFDASSGSLPLMRHSGSAPPMTRVETASWTFGAWHHGQGLSYSVTTLGGPISQPANYSNQAINEAKRQTYLVLRVDDNHQIMLAILSPRTSPQRKLARKFWKAQRVLVGRLVPILQPPVCLLGNMGFHTKPGSSTTHILNKDFHCGGICPESGHTTTNRARSPTSTSFNIYPVPRKEPSDFM